MNTMYYKDIDFSPEKLCDEVWNRFELDLEVEEYPKGVFLYSSVEGIKEPITKDVATFINQAYDGCGSERCGHKLRVYTV